MIGSTKWATVGWTTNASSYGGRRTEDIDDVGAAY